MKYFIGLDAHSSTSTFAVLDQEGQCILRKTVDTSEKNLWNVIESIQGERVLTFEESTISQWLYISLREKVDRLLVCNPTYVAKKSGAKTDFRDALHLANELIQKPLAFLKMDNLERGSVPNAENFLAKKKPLFPVACINLVLPRGFEPLLPP